MAQLVAEVGSVLVQRYALERELGRGGMATVYLARDEKLQRLVALKLLHPELGAALGPERFLREVALVSRLSHPHILPLRESGEVDGRPFYVMPYVEGESLRQRLVRERQLPVEEAFAIVRAVAEALDHAHQAGVIHRDIKPENILLARDPAGGPPHPLVADFGIARALDVAGGERLTETGVALGTPSYLSPEQAAGGTGVDGRTDVYALGCVAYELLAGSPPFTGPTAQAIMARHAVDPVPPLRTVRPGVPEPVIAAIERALAKVPADRFATAGEFAEALVAAPAPSRQHLGRGARHRTAFVLGSAAAVVAVAAATAIWRKGQGPPVIPAAATMAVLPFSSGTPDTALGRLGRDLATTISASLDGVGGIRTTDRLTVATATARRPSLSAAEAAALGWRLGASSVLRGTLVRAGDVVRLDLGLYRTDGLVPLAEGITVSGHRDSLAALTDSASWAVLRQVWQRGEPPSPSLAAVTTQSVPALRAFLDGERSLESDRWGDAELAYRSAIAADSAFWLAQFRYQQTRYWTKEGRFDPVLIDRLYRYRETFPEPDRLILEAWSASRRNSVSAQLASYQEATRRFPNYWPGWFMLGDYLTHYGPFLGYGWAESQRALDRAVALNPRLEPAWDHLFANSVGMDTLEAGRALAAMLDLDAQRARSPRGHSERPRLGRLRRLTYGVAHSGGHIVPGIEPLADSLAREYRSVARPGRELPAEALLGRFPAAQVELNRKVLRLDVPPSLATGLLRWIAWAWAERGAWDSALVVMREAVEAEPTTMDDRGPTPMEEYGLAVLGVWLGALDPAEALSRRPSARAMIDAASEARKPDFRVMLAWLDGVLAFARRDGIGLEKARNEGLRAGRARADTLDRSLSAFSRALAGDRAGAARALAALEWHCAGVAICVPYAATVPVQRMAAASWLLESGDSAQAARLLVWHEAMQPGWFLNFSFAAAPLAYLMLARIEDAQGKTALARAHYHQFLRRYDSPMPGQVHLVEEARLALALLRVRE
jgi:serine/threonine-protein kinase